MFNKTQFAVLKRGPAAWNAWRADNPGAHVQLATTNLSGAKLVGADLSRVTFANAQIENADLRDVNLEGSNLERAFLNGTNLTDANLYQANLDRASFVEADLTRANLYRAQLTKTDLRGANLSEATLALAIFRHAHLADAIFLRAYIIDTVFSDVDLSTVKGLATCEHAGPSALDFRTLLRSGSSLPVDFLRGCGMPDRLIDYLPSVLNAGPIQFYSCFISYSTADQDFANRLYADLQARSVRCWFAPHHMQPGRKIHEQIDEAIRVYERLLLILSADSMKSEWVATEIAKARKKEATQNRRVLFPIALVPFKELESWELFDADRGKDSAREIREYYIPDFSGWKDHDTYTKAFDGLLKALRSADVPPIAAV